MSTPLYTTAFEVTADPYPFTMTPASTALALIDFQRDFLEPGGFGELLGNDVSLLARAVGPTASVLEAARAAGILIVHTRVGHRPDLSAAPPTKLAHRFQGINDEQPITAHDLPPTQRSAAAA